MGEQSVEDREANYFAMCLLMPEQFLRRDIAEMGGIDLTEDRPIRKLAQRYGVSVAMMALRLRQLQLTGDAG
jgi:Zn-dependent peptidase ImmA (M78 family)